MSGAFNNKFSRAFNPEINETKPMKYFQTIKQGEDTLLREKIETTFSANKDARTLKKSIANARILINPQPGKTEYAENELTLCEAAKKSDGTIKSYPDTVFINLTDEWEKIQVFKYIGAKTEAVEEAADEIQELSLEALNDISRKWLKPILELGYAPPKEVVDAFREGVRIGANWARQQTP